LNELKEQSLYKNFSNLNGLDFDFNGLSNFLDKYNLATKISSNYNNDFITEAVYQCRGVHTTPEFAPINEEIEKKFNPNGTASDLDLFFSMVSGAKSITHVDACDVCVLNLCGIVHYRLGEESFQLGRGDLLVIPANITHKAIGLTPRITASYATFSGKSPLSFEEQVNARRQLGMDV